MAAQRLVIDGYGQIELNNCAFRRDGRIEAQCKPNKADFADAKKVLENGMLLAVDNVAREVKLPVSGSDLPIAINYSTEHIYDERTPGLKNFFLKGANDFLPRLGYLAVGDKFTENCISFDNAVDTAWKADPTITGDTDSAAFCRALLAADLGATPIYGGISADGSVLVSATKPTEGPVLRVVKATTMPDKQFGLKFQVYAC